MSSKKNLYKMQKTTAFIIKKDERCKIMSTVSLTPQELRDQAKVYISARDGIEYHIGTVDRVNRQMEAQWKGKAFQAYLVQYSELEGYVKKFKELLVSINGQLESYAETVAQRDDQDAKGFGLN